MLRALKLGKKVISLLNADKAGFDLLPKEATDKGDLSERICDAETDIFCYHRVSGTFGICHVLDTHEVFIVEIAFKVISDRILEQASIKAMLFSMSGSKLTIEGLASTVLSRMYDRLSHKECAVRVRCVNSEFNVTNAEVLEYGGAEGHSLFSKFNK